jgi:hypothetical protein
MKKPLLLFFLLLAAAVSRSQNFEGTWRGVMVQDSPVVRINFEMVLEKKEGKIIGYLYRLFIVEDSLIYNTVKVVARVSDNVLIVEDDESVSRNFEERANRKIKAAYFFKINPKNLNSDSLKGEWTTSRFKNKYMSISGTVNVTREPQYETTQLFKRLEEKQLHRSIAFVPKFTGPDMATNTTRLTGKPSETKPISENVIIKEPEIKNEPVVITPVKKDTVQSSVAATIKTQVQQNTTSQPVIETKPQPSTVTETKTQQKTENASNNSLKTNPAQKKDSIQSSVTANNKPAIQQNNTQKPVIETKPQPNAVSSTNPVKTNSPASTNQQQAQVQSKPQPANNSPVVNQPKTTAPAVVKTEPLKQPAVVTNQQQTNSTAPKTNPAPEPTPANINKTDAVSITESKPVVEKPTIAPPVINNPVLTTRATEVIQTLAIAEDSVVLSLYDNGEIDGDVVSIFLNNDKIIENVSLKASAYKKTIYFKQGETVQLTLFAENLGSIPPNTGLLVVYSGDKRYQVFFTSTLNKSSVVLLKRE